MTRRIATAILLTVWATLLLAGATAYFVTRSMLLENLDQSLVQRAVALPELTDTAGNRYASQPFQEDDDRYLVQDASGRNVSTPKVEAARAKQNPAYATKLLHAAFTAMPDGTRSRTVTLQAFGRSIDNPKSPPKPVMVTYRGSAEDFDNTMSLLTWTLIGSGLAGGIIAAFATRAIARAALRPVERTAEMIGAIDERALDQRIEPHRLPIELRPVALRCNEMLARLENAFARQRRFLADASHELRTPVAALMTTLEVTLRRPRSDEEYLEALRSALADAKLMRSLVESLMNQARSEIDALDEPRESVDVAATIDQVVSSLTAFAHERGVSLQQNVDRSFALSVQPSRLRSVLLNLVGNAIEHNRSGGHVHVTAQRVGEVGTITIQDDGPGIAPEHVGNIFEPFYRADRSRGSDGHLGLGLFLVKTHVQKMNGQITLKSDVGVGTSFKIELPAQVQESRQMRNFAKSQGIDDQIAAKSA